MSRIALIVTLVVSMVTIVFGVLEMAFQRSHNIKSVRPLCAITQERSKGRLLFFLRNVGLGPLIIEAVTMEPASGSPSSDPLMPEDDRFTDLVIPPLGSVELFALSHADDEELGGRAKPGEDQVICIRYHDIYDRRHTKRYLVSELLHGPKLQLPQS